MGEEFQLSPSTFISGKPNSRKPLSSGASSRARSVAHNLPESVLQMHENKSIHYRKQLIAVEVTSRKGGKLLSLLKNLVLLCRFIILISPSLTTDFKSVNKDGLIYNVNLACSVVVLTKIVLVVRKKRRHYFRNLAPCVDFVANCGVFLASMVYTINEMLDFDVNAFHHFYFWATCCFVNLLAICSHLSHFKLISETFSVILLALKLNYPFLFVISVLYLEGAVIGGFLFGGQINSLTPKFMEDVGQGTKPEYIYQNWNDFLNSLVYLWGINLNNNLTMYVSISTVNEGPHRNLKPIFFFIFFILNNVILRNIFFGQVIEICLEYFKVIHQEEKRVSVVGVDQTQSVHGMFAHYKNIDDSQKILRVKI